VIKTSFGLLESPEEESRHPSQAVTREDSAHRAEDRNAERWSEAEDVFENEVSGEKKQEFVRDRQADDTEDKARKDAPVSVLSDPNRQNLSRHSDFPRNLKSTGAQIQAAVQQRGSEKNSEPESAKNGITIPSDLSLTAQTF